MIRSLIDGFKKVSTTIKITIDILKYIFSLERLSVTALFLLCTLEATLPFLSLWLAKYVVDVLTVPEQATAPNTFLNFLIGFVVIGILAQVCATFGQTLRERIGQKIESHSEVSLLKKVNSFSEITVFENPEFYNHLRNATEGSGRRFVGVIDIMVLATRSLLMLGGSVAILGSVHWSLGVIVLVGMLPHSLVTFWINGFKAQVFRAQAHDTREQRYYASVLTSQETAKEVRAFHLGSFFLDKYQEAFSRVYDRSQRFRQHALKVGTVSGVFSGAVSAGVFSWIALQAYNGFLTVGDAVLYIGLLPQAMRTLSLIFGQLASLHFVSLHVKYFFDFLKLELPHNENEVAENFQSKDTVTGYEFRNVSFKYPGADRPAIENVSFTIEPGEKVAVVGRNGAGKSTLVKLMLRLYQPDAGVILLDGIPLKDYASEDLRKKTSVVFQDFAKFYLSIRDNIALGDLSKDQNDWIESAAQKAQVDDFANELPQGYDTLLGKHFDGGVELSGGQWQRISLARAFARDADLIVLDEPSSALDPIAESHLYERFRDLTNDKSALFITHRLGSVRIADKIIVINDGKIVGVGSHNELMAAEGDYAVLFRTQAENYVDGIFE